MRRDQLTGTDAIGRRLATLESKVRERAAQLTAYLRRADGSLAAQLSSAWSWLDKAGNQLVAEDAIAGSGLARPWIAYTAPVDDNYLNWPRTGAASWTTIARSRGIVQHPKLKIRTSMATDGTAAGQIRLCVNGSPIATGAIGAELNTVVAVPGFLYLTEVEFTIQAQVTSGSGSVYGVTRFLYGVQS